MQNIINDVEERMLPLSPVQQGMLFHCMLLQEKTYVEQMYCTISGELDVPLFNEAVSILIQNHDMLRTFFPNEYESIPKQVIRKEVKFKCNYFDYSTQESAKEKIDKVIAKRIEVSFNLARETYRCDLYKVEHNEYIFCCTYHHIILDAWSERILQKDFSMIYLALLKKNPVSLPQYNYENMINWIDMQNKEDAYQYWKRYLHGLHPININWRYASNNMSVSYDMKTIILNTDTTLRINNFCDKYRTTRNMFITSMWGMYLIKYFDNYDMVFGIVINGRMIPLKNVDKIVGLFINTIPLRVSKHFRVEEWIEKVQTDIFNAAKYSYLSLSDILHCGGLNVASICSCINFPFDSKEVENEFSVHLPFSIHDICYNEQASYNVYLDVHIQNDEIRIDLHYAEDKFDFSEHDIKRDFEYFLQQINENPKQNIGELVSGEACSNNNFAEMTKFKF